MNLPFNISLSALWIILAIFILSYLLKLLFLRSPQPYLFYSNLKDFSPQKKNLGRIKWISLPVQLYLSALFLFALAFLDPHFILAPKPFQNRSQLSPLPKEGIAIYLVLDQSGSMSQPAFANIDGQRRSTTKMNVLKHVAKQFILSRSSDLIGLVAFARIPDVISPLTLDKKLLEDKLEQVQVVKSKERDGTAMGYAIFKTAHLIAATRHFAQELNDQAKPAYEIKNTIMIVATDGLQDPNPLDKGNRLRTLELEDAADYVRSEGIRLYIINIDPKFAQEQFAPHRRLMEKITSQTGGQFFLVNAGQDLEQIYSTINQLEKETIRSNLHTPPQQLWHLAPFLISAGIACFGFGFLLSSTLLRQVP